MMIHPLRRICLILATVALAVHADTLPPGMVKIKGGTDGTAIGNVGDALKVNAAVTVPGTVSVTQGTSPWVVSGTVNSVQSGSWTTGRTWTLLNSTDSVNAVQSGSWTTGRTWSLSSGTDSVTITGTVSATNSANGNTGSAVPAQATQVAGSDGVNLRALKVSSTGVLSVDGSASTQPVSGSVSVSNFPGVQAVSQSGSWTVSSTQGTSPWVENLTQLNGATPSATNYLPSRITNGVSYVDPTQIRALTSADVVMANQGGSWTVTANAGTGTFQTNVTNASIPVTQSGSWSVGRTWSLASGTDSVSAVQSGAPWSVSGSGNFTVVQPTGTNLHVVVDTAPTTSVTQGTSPWVVSGTVTANQGGAPWSVSQSGTWNINNISGTISLPTGAATEASLAKLTIAQGTALGSNTQALMGGSVTTSVPSYTTGQISPLSLTLRGALRTKVVGLDTVSLIRNAYTSTNVTTAAYVQLVASTSADINRLYIFDSSGQDLVLAVGAAAAEVDQIQIPPGGWDAAVELFIPSGSRISIKAVSATASTGVLLITGLK